jgi:hypothetical protein
MNREGKGELADDMTHQHVVVSLDERADGHGDPDEAGASLLSETSVHELVKGNHCGLK